ncbi:MAG: hypothetical protein V3S22_04095, partial [Candidatus Neomarinimicrobiota bacterium]
NAWTEISALITSITVTIGLEAIAAFQIEAGEVYTLFGKAPVLFGFPLQVHHKLLIIVPISIIVWLLVTFFTKPEPDLVLRQFYERVQPGGWWGRISAGFIPTKTPVTKGFVQNWIAGTAMIYGMTFAIGHFIFGNYWNGFLLTAIAVGAFAWIWSTTISKLDTVLNEE